MGRYPYRFTDSNRETSSLSRVYCRGGYSKIHLGALMNCNVGGYIWLTRKFIYGHVCHSLLKILEISLLLHSLLPSSGSLLHVGHSTCISWMHPKSTHCDQSGRPSTTSTKRMASGLASALGGRVRRCVGSDLNSHAVSGRRKFCPTKVSRALSAICSLCARDIDRVVTIVTP
jgi:hypothetical protein